MKEIYAHTGLRGIASVLVLISHLALVSPHFHIGLNAVGGPAVDLFFMLSGFILCYVYHQGDALRPKGGWWAYAVARFARLYPLYVTVVVLFVIFFAVLPLKDGEPIGRMGTKPFLLQVIPVFAWPGVFSNSLNPAAWSVSVEIFCYIFIFPLTMLTARWLRWPALYLPLLYVITFAVMYYVAYTPGTNFLQWKAVARGITGFYTGFVLFHLFHTQPGLTHWVQRWGTWLSVLAVVAVSVLAAWGLGHVTVWALLLVWPTLVLGVSGDNNLVARLLGCRFFRFFGDISYGLYLIHLPVIMGISWLYGDRNRPDHPYDGWPVTVITPLAVILISWLSYRFLETPARRWLRRKLGRTRRELGTSRDDVAAG